ncbi:MAG TPA: DUF5674 family protein [bacterium]|nr:DUF5674 family protein [bacterium]
MEIIKRKVSLEKLQESAKELFGNLVKAVVDIENGTMAIGGELHSDEESILLQQGSKQKNLWGINIYPFLTGDEMIEFDSIINLRPSNGNLSRYVEDPLIREKVRQIVKRLTE